MNRNSIRWKLSVYMLVGTAILLLVAGGMLEFMVRSWLSEELDESLRTKARAFVSLTEQEEDQIEFDFAPDVMPEFEDDEEPEYYQVWDGDSVFQRSVSLGAESLLRDEERSLDSRISDVNLPDGRSGRQIQIDFVPLFSVEDDEFESEDSFESEEDGDDDDLEEIAMDPSELSPGTDRRVVTIVIAKGTETLDEAIGLFRLVLSGVAILLITAIGLMIRIVVPRGLAPLSEVGSQVAALDENSLGKRIDVSSEAEEIAPLVITLNNLLVRLERAFERERHFSSDVAHELRTPVAELRSLSEVGAKWPDDVESVRQFFRDVQDVSESMEHTINNLLALARCDSGIEEIAEEDVLVGRTIDTLWRKIERSARASQIRLDQRIPADLVVRTDQEKFQLIMMNLLGNAVSYSRPGGTVSCRARNGGNRIALEIENPVVDLTEDDLEAMFDRFWRKDPARTGSDHSGLGLALVRSLSDLLNFDLETSLQDRGGERLFRISLSRSQR